MKRFWLERYMFRTSSAMAPLRVSGASFLYLFVIIFVYFVPSSCAEGESCDIHKFAPCSNSHEVCVEVKNNTSVCICLAPYEVNKETGICETPKPPPEPSGNNLGLALGLGITFFLVFVILALALIHRKFGLFSGMCDRFPSLRSLTIRSGDIIMVDNGDEDINPIV